MLNVLLLNSLTPILSFLARDVGVNANIVVCRGRVPGLETAARRAVPVVPRSPSLQHTLLGQSRQGEDGVLLQCSTIRIVNTNCEAQARIGKGWQGIALKVKGLKA